MNQQLLLEKKSGKAIYHTIEGNMVATMVDAQVNTTNMVDAQARNYSRSALETHDFNHDGWLEQLR